MYSDDQYDDLLRKFEKDIHFGVSYDVLRRQFVSGGRRCTLYMIDGCTSQDEVALFLTRMMACPEKDGAPAAFAEVVARYLPYGEVKKRDQYRDILNDLLSGSPVLFAEGVPGALMIDAREIPQRLTTEPDKERSLRGSHDGFTEILVHNTALIRKRLRTPDLIFEALKVGVSTKSEAILCHMEGRVDEKYLDSIRERIRSCPAEGLAMNQEPLAEHLVKVPLWNPFPRIRQSERPDMISAALLEGKVVILVDNASTAMILPARFLDFFKEANDYYFPPFIGSYYRIVRVAMIFIALFLTPFVLLMNRYASSLSSFWDFMLLKEPAEIPLYAQFLVYEFLVGMLRMSALNVPNNVGTALSTVSAIIVGEFAVNAGWASNEVVFFMSFVAVTLYAQQNLELGYTLKYTRILYLTAVELFGVWGFVIFPVLLFTFLALMKTDDGKPYFSPIIPFRPKELKPLFFRSRIKR